MKRVFLVDVLQCEICGGAMKILAAIHPPDTIQRILECLRLPMKKNNAVNNYDQSCRRRDRQMDHPGTRARRRRQAS